MVKFHQIKQVGDLSESAYTSVELSHLYCHFVLYSCPCITYTQNDDDRYNCYLTTCPRH